MDREPSGHGPPIQFCSKCIKRQRSDSYKSWAERDLNREARNRYQRQNRERFALKQKLRKYGVTQEEYDALEKRCAVCGTGNSLCFDHDHRTGLFRGLLCRRHNRILGQLDDDPAQILALYWYLVTAPEGPILDPTLRVPCPCECGQDMAVLDSRGRIMRSLPGHTPRKNTYDRSD